MAKAAADHTASQHSVDDVFQVLVHARGMRETKAKEEIQNALRHEDLQVDFRVDGVGAMGRVHPGSWETLFRLSIRDGHLVVVQRCALDYPWDHYVLTVANWWFVDELWPAKPGSPAAPAQAVQEPRRPTKVWLGYAIKQHCDELVGMGPEPVAKYLAPLMKAGHYNPERPVGWKRLKNILTDDKQLLIKAPGKRPKSAR